MPQPEGRPVGVTIVALYYFGLGVLSLAGGVLFTVAWLSDRDAFLAGLVGFAGLTLLVGTLLAWVFAYGLWKLHKWAWLLATVGALVALGASILQGAALQPTGLLGVIPLVLAWYMLRTRTRAAFRL